MAEDRNDPSSFFGSTRHRPTSSESAPVFSRTESMWCHSYYKNSYVTWAPGIVSRHLVNGCVLKFSCIVLMVFRNLSCLGIIICYMNTIWIVPAYACNVLNVCDALVYNSATSMRQKWTKWTRHVKRDCDVAQWYTSSGDAKQVLARPAFSLWRQHNVHAMEQWSAMRCCTTRHLTSNFWTRYTQITWFLFSATSYDLVCF